MTEWTSPDKARAKELFKNVEPFRAIISGSIEHGRGRIHVDSIDDPKVGWWSFGILNAVAGDSHCDVAKHIIEQFPYMMILCVPNKSWEDLVRSTWGEHLYTMPRTRLSEKTLDLKYLR